MMRTLHLDSSILAQCAAGATLTPDVTAHLRVCTECQRDLDSWCRVAEATRTWVVDVAPAGDDLQARVLAAATDYGRTERRRRPKPARPEKRHAARWWALASVAVVAIVLASLLVLTRPTNSEAAVLRQIRSGPALAAKESNTTYLTGTVSYRAQAGYFLSAYQLRESIGWSTNSFRVASLLLGFGPLQRLNVDSLSNGIHVYFPNGYFNPANGVTKLWVAYPASQTAPGGRSLQLGSLRGAEGPVVDLGQRTMDGTTVSGYEVTVPGSFLAAETPPSMQSLERATYRGVKVVRLKVWIDAQGLPRALQSTYRQAQPGITGLVSVTQTMTVSYTSTPLDVAAPRADQTAFVPSYGAAIAYYQGEERTARHNNA